MLMNERIFKNELTYFPFPPSSVWTGLSGLIPKALSCLRVNLRIRAQYERYIEKFTRKNYF